MDYWLAFEGLIDKLVGLSVHLAGDPGKLPCLEGAEGFVDFFVELGGSRVLVPSTRYLVDNLRGIAERGDILESFLGGELETANQSVVLGFVGAAHGSHFLGDRGQHRATVGFLENDPDGALRLALFVGSSASVDEQQVVALLEVIDHEEPLTWTSILLLSPLLLHFGPPVPSAANSGGCSRLSQLGSRFAGGIRAQEDADSHN